MNRFIPNSGIDIIISPYLTETRPNKEKARPTKLHHSEALFVELHTRERHPLCGRKNRVYTSEKQDSTGYFHIENQGLGVFFSDVVLRVSFSRWRCQIIILVRFIFGFNPVFISAESIGVEVFGLK